MNTKKPMLDFGPAFEHGHVFLLGDEEAVVRVTSLGSVDLPTGVVEIVDPLTYSEEAEDRKGEPQPDVPPGTYRVEWSHAEFPVAARVIFAEAPAARWEPLGYGVGVDGGVAAFADDSSLPLLSAIADGALLAAVPPHPGGELIVGSRGLGPLRFGGRRVVFFSTEADGEFSCLWGISSAEQIVSLVVDLGGLWRERTNGAHFELADLLRRGPLAHPELAKGVAIELVRSEAKKLVLAVDGYDVAAAWELRRADGTRLNHGKLYYRDKGVLELSIPDGLPEGAYLFVGRDGPLRPMKATGEIRES